MSNVSYKFSMSTAQLNFFLDKIHDLLSIDDEILFKINKDNTLFYVVVGEKSNVNAFKSFIFKTNEVFSFTDDIPKEIRYIVKKGAKFESTIKNYLDYDEDVHCEFFMNDDTYADILKLKNSKLKLSIIGGDIRGMNTNIDIEKIKKTVNIDNIDFKFTLDKNSFTKIKKIGAVDNENDILTLDIADNSLTIGEDIQWNLKICDITHDDLSITFPKKYFKSITFTDDEDITIYVFDTFLFIDNQNTSLLIALELTI
jgi:hypothetical protein